MTTKPQVLTVDRYTFFKTQANPLTDSKIAEIYDMTMNQLNAFKKENDLVGKFDLKKIRPTDVKTYKASELKKEEVPIEKKEPPLLKENDIAAKQSLQKTLDEYDANRKLQEKLKARKAVQEEGQPDPEENESLDEEEITVVPEAESLSNIKDQLKKEMEGLRKEKAWLEERHVKDTAEKDLLREQLEKAKQDTHFMSLILQVNEDVKAERFRQNSIYGHQRHAYGTWLAILAEEFGEVAQAMQVGWGWGKASDADDLYKELTHVSAVSSAFAEQVLEERLKGQEGSGQECLIANDAAAL